MADSFAHPGEKGRRRDLNKHWYEPVMCAAARRGEACAAGDGCRFAHNVFEVRARGQGGREGLPERRGRRRMQKWGGGQRGEGADPPVRPPLNGPPLTTTACCLPCASLPTTNPSPQSQMHLHPLRYRTSMCTDGSACRRAICFFAHNIEELRRPTDSGAAAAGVAGGSAPLPQVPGAGAGAGAGGSAAALLSQHGSAAAALAADVGGSGADSLTLASPTQWPQWAVLPAGSPPALAAGPAAAAAALLQLSPEGGAPPPLPPLPPPPLHHHQQQLLLWQAAAPQLLATSAPAALQRPAARYVLCAPPLPPPGDAAVPPFPVAAPALVVPLASPPPPPQQQQQDEQQQQQQQLIMQQQQQILLLQRQQELLWQAMFMNPPN